MRYRTSCILLLALLAAGSLAAGDPANLSGEWTFNQAKSVLDENGAMFLPAQMILAQAGNDLTVQKTFSAEGQGDFTSEDKLTLDGKECKSEFMNSPRTAIANWSAKGDTLSIDTRIEFDMDDQKSEMTMKEALSLKDEGKTLAVQHFSSSSWGERKLTLIYDRKEPKQEPAKEPVK